MRPLPLLAMCLIVVPKESVQAQSAASKPSAPQARRDEVFPFLPSKDRDAEQCREARQRDRAREDGTQRDRWAWIGESNDVAQLLTQLGRWAPHAAVRSGADRE